MGKYTDARSFQNYYTCVVLLGLITECPDFRGGGGDIGGCPIPKYRVQKQLNTENQN